MKHRYSFLIFLYSLFAVSCSQGETATDGESEYPLMTLQREDRRLTEEYSAVMRGLQDVEVRPQVSGTITQVCVNEGAEVKQGQVLFVIDQVPYKAAVEVAKAAVATAEAAEEIARQTLEGKEMLHTEKVISDFDLRTAQNEYKSAQAATMQARAELVNAQNNLSYTEVKSPVDGVAGMTDVRIGTLVSSSMSEPLISVSDNSQMLAYFSLVEKQVLSLTRQYGSLDKVLSSFPDVSLRLNDGTIYEHTGKIDVISGIIDKTTEEEVMPGDVSAEMLKSGNYRVVQDKGEANSLGRMIFRFDNDFAIYLHDTPNRRAFNYKQRTVSHGCIRLEKPLELAVFLLDEKDPLVIDKIKIAIDMPPDTEKGKELANDEDYKRIGLKTFKPEVPLYITYYTAYPDNDGNVVYTSDPYGYDERMSRLLGSY